MLALVTVVVAVLAFSAALTYRQLQRRRTANYFAVRIANTDPAIRAQACTQWAEFGLHRSAPLFLYLIEREQDQVVLTALADAIRARAWEPESSRQITQLRQFATDFHRRQQT